MILLISTSQVARIIGVSHLRLTDPFILMSIENQVAWHKPVILALRG
jgi:hypothetical protein